MIDLLHVKDKVLAQEQTTTRFSKQSLRDDTHLNLKPSTMCHFRLLIREKYSFEYDVVRKFMEHIVHAIRGGGGCLVDKGERCCPQWHIPSQFSDETRH